jgi:hypothetical protein
MSGYLDYSGRDDVLSGGARKIPVTTPQPIAVPVNPAVKGL